MARTDDHPPLNPPHEPPPGADGAATVPDTATTVAGTEPDTATTVAGTEPDTATTVAGTEPDTATTVAGTEPDTATTVAGTEPDTATTVAGTEPDTATTVAGTEPDTATTVAGTEPDTATTVAGSVPVGEAGAAPTVVRAVPGAPATVAAPPVPGSAAPTLPAAPASAPADNGAAAKASFALRPGTPLGEDLARVAGEQIDGAARRLRDHAVVSAEDVHEARKSLKRLRALTRLLRPALGRQAYSRENEALRDAARHLAGARDAEVMVLTFDALLRYDDRPASADGYAALRAHLQAEREQAAAQLLADAGPARRAARDLDPVRDRVPHWLGQDAGFGAIEPGLRRIYREGRERQRTARRQPTAEHLHEWRKRVKDLRYCAELLGPIDPARLAKVGARADRLGEMLGDDHDLAVLAAFATEHRELFTMGTEQRSLLRLIERRRKQLRKRSLKLGGQLYARGPRRFTRPLVRRARRPAAPR